MLKHICLAAGHVLLGLTIRAGGPLYRWTRKSRQLLQTFGNRLAKNTNLLLTTAMVLLVAVGLTDNVLHRSLSLDPFNDRLIFRLLGQETEEDPLPGKTETPASASDPLPVTTMINGETVVLKPQILQLVSTRKTTLVYRVENGDTLSSIADRFRLKLTTILWENKLSMTSTLQIGQSLTVLPVDGVRHTIRSGDTIAALAKRYNADQEKILEFNGLKPKAPLRLAADLIIPDGRPAFEPPARPRTRLAQIQNFISRSVSKPVQRLGQMLWPTPLRRLTQYFSWRHPGIDIKGAMGSPVYAANGGTVTEAGWNRGGYGNQVILTHTDGRRTRYAHLSKIGVRVGNSVRQGEVIGLVGSTGRSTGPHLHFEVMAGGRRLNPLGVLR